jgi:hypothetical protein
MAFKAMASGSRKREARVDTDHVFRYTPDADHVAGCNTWDDEQEEAKYPDSEYTLRFFAQDDYGRVNRDMASGRNVNARLTVIVRNFQFSMNLLETA